MYIFNRKNSIQWFHYKFILSTMTRQMEIVHLCLEYDVDTSTNNYGWLLLPIISLRLFGGK